MTALLCDSPIEAFAQFTDTDAMGAIWRKQLPALLGQPFKFTACNVQYARCRTYLNPDSWHKSFLCVCYEFETTPDRYSSYKPMLYVRAYLDGRSRHQFDALANHAGAQLVPELDMLAWNFPHDPQLSQLHELLDAARVARHFPYPNLPFSADAIFDIKINVVRYRPEQRCILRYDISYGADRSRYVLYAKVFADDNGERVFSRIQQCYARASVLGVRIARPLGYGAAVRTVWQEELCGTPPTALHDAGAYEASMAAIGHCLAKLHAAGLPMQKSITREARLIDASKKSRKLAQMLPWLDSELKTIVARAQSELPQLPATRDTIIHGDVHLGQFLITDDGALALFDFDEWSYGDPAQDLADLIVDPHVSKFMRDESEMNYKLPPCVARTLLASYREHAERTVTDAAIDWHARVQLINKAYRAMIQMEPHWREKVSALVALASHGIDLGADPEKEIHP